MSTGRYAPSPSGRMHLGNLMCCLLAWLSAKSKGGQVLLRIEDLDTQRCPRSYADAIVDDLAWLGLAADGPTPPVYQSDRSEIYQRYFDELSRRGLVYPCFCSRSQLHAASAPHRSDGQVIYAGTCRGLTPAEIAERSKTRAPAWRVQVPDEVIAFEDGHMGHYEENLARDCGDFFLRRADGVFAYQLAVVVDDALMGVDEVVRGSDLLSSTPRQLWLYREQGYRFASVGWPGMIGVLSGMNETGLTVTINAAKSAVPTGSATPISILTREILQYAATIDEAFAIAKKRETFVSESILIGSAKDGKAAIIEKSPEKTVLFTGKEANRLICTNHYQSEEFSKDERNMENIRTSDSPYRFARLTELINEDLPIDVSKAASILRDHKGLQNTDLGLANEMTINQFIAHHSVIFQPEKRLMWVSTSPWQCGKYVAYDLNKIFKDTIDWQHEIYSSDLTIPEDKFIDTPEFQHLLTYKKLTPLLLKKIRKKEQIEESVLKTYQASNPSLYYVYEVIGDYYEAMQQSKQAIAYWQQALKKSIPKLQEKERIQQKIQKQSKDGKES